MPNSTPTPESLSGPDPEAAYQALRQSHQATLTSFGARRATAGWLLVAAAVLAVFGLLQTLHGGPAWPLLLATAAAIALILWNLSLSSKSGRAERLLNYYDRNLLRLTAEPPAELIDTGDSLRQPGHLYEHDLNLLGPASLLGHLDTVRTGIGLRGLANYLQLPATQKETLDRQAAVRELTPLTAVRESIALLGTSRFQQVEARFFDAWLDADAPAFPVWVRPVLILTATALVVMLLLGVTHAFPWGTLLPNLLAVGVLQSAISLWLAARVKPLLEATSKLYSNVRMFSEGLALLDRQTFQSKRLTELQQAARTPANAVPLLATLQNQVTLTQQRTKELFYLFTLLLALGTQAAITLSAWKRRNGEAMRGWLAAWAEFEALNALANFAFEHPTYTWPELLPPTTAPTFEATALAHPLLPQGIANDITLTPGQRFYLISGSNMSGKSTLLRSVGINAVLAYAGAPVRATSLRLTPLRIGAALALTDSLAEGKSRFLAEVERLQHIVQASHGAPVLFLVDEIFSGTNSADRHAAAEAVLRTLLAHGAIGALSTHDLALTELATEANTGANVHMASPDPEDPLAFDYRLKPGINTRSNALAIIRMMGLEA